MKVRSLIVPVIWDKITLGTKPKRLYSGPPRTGSRV
jgi:hypothetical protein